MMQIDNTTYTDLAVFQTTDEFSIFTKLDRTRTVGGRIQLFELFNHPFSQPDKIRQTQEILRIIRDNENGLLATTQAEWISQLTRLLHSSSLRERLGNAGRATVEAEYSTSIHAPRVYHIFESVVKEARQSEIRDETRSASGRAASISRLDG